MRNCSGSWGMTISPILTSGLEIWYGILEDEVSISQLPDTLGQQIDNQNQCLGLCEDGSKRETEASCHIDRVMPFSPLTFSPLIRICWILGGQTINISAPWWHRQEYQWSKSMSVAMWWWNQKRNRTQRPYWQSYGTFPSHFFISFLLNH